MDNKFDGVTAKQIDYMKHALGYERKLVKRNIYKFYRNYFTTSNTSETWQRLINLGLATGRPFSHGIGDNPMCYAVTDEGKKFLADLLGIKIISRD